MNARVCACIGLFGGIDARSIGGVVGLSYYSVYTYHLRPLLLSGCISRHRRGKGVLYHLTKAGRALIRAEQDRLVAESLGLVGLLKSIGRVKLDKVEILERALLGNGG